MIKQRGGRWLKNHIEHFRVGKSTKSSQKEPILTRPRRHLCTYIRIASNGSSFIMATQLVPSVGAILLIGGITGSAKFPPEKQNS